MRRCPGGNQGADDRGPLVIPLMKLQKSLRNFEVPATVSEPLGGAGEVLERLRGTDNDCRSLGEAAGVLEGLRGAGELKGTSVMEESLLLLPHPRQDLNILCK